MNPIFKEKTKENLRSPENNTKQKNKEKPRGKVIFRL
jgi:hypothetical protein